MREYRGRASVHEALFTPAHLRTPHSVSLVHAIVAAFGFALALGFLATPPASADSGDISLVVAEQNRELVESLRFKALRLRLAVW